MGNGSAKAKRSKKPSPDPLTTRVDQLEQELRGKDQELAAKEQVVRSLQEKIAAQEQALMHLSQELRKKQQNGVQNQNGDRMAAGVPGVGIKETLNKRKGAKAGVSAEPTSRTYDCNHLPKFSFDKARVPKESSVKKQLVEALNRNQYLKRLEPQQLRDIVECMFLRKYQQGDFVVRQGEVGNHLFVLADGKLDVFQEDVLVSSMMAWTAFGELAILYNCMRTASVRAVNRVCTWALEREAFQNIMRRTSDTRHHQYEHFLRSVSLLADLPDDKISKIVDCLEVEYYNRGDYVIREGEEGSTFYIIAQGKVKVTQTTKGHKSPQVINTLQKGDYFGEKALISNDVRSANIVADDDGLECLLMDRQTFNQTVGTFDSLQKHLQGYVATLDRKDMKRHASRKSLSRHPSQTLPPDMLRLKQMAATFPPSRPLDHMDVVATLGVGGFGRVELVKVKGEDVTFALKVIKKKHVVDNRQEEHIHSERRILAEASSPFVVRLFRTFRDDKYVYMLLEACLGGEVWSLLRDRGSFDEPTAKFCVGCVTEAFEYLHRKVILYRDLKPENLMLDSEGYVKLVDFGFAKKMRGGQKTWTFCGTPEYVAPEIILNKGHNLSVDFWSLGILVFELLTGSPPFTGSDQMATYTSILKGVDKMHFPKKIAKRPQDLIRKLCRFLKDQHARHTHNPVNRLSFWLIFLRGNPAERLGNMKGGIGDINKHRWFNGFDWARLKAQTLPSPLKRHVSGPLDHSHFDVYPPDDKIPPDELSGWDADF
ncbi:cGMP-dependent protein kinase 2 isoform X1 [Syngnathus typhle]|uniref:cGMP-dependent protein kinase 2 isoform X1 n=1 Tax=Syngnathus typhle TaxID=161592 RepID=UPI002A6A2EB4|nr:cGMP-dependent protein kinase 2 isoform X1 [Syngnathus typhle]XP_061135073.1 cGMP-dependent protein kinase 2 isoform X1 [Syngnathus typhle]